jgi:hypothetical protein
MFTVILGLFVGLLGSGSHDTAADKTLPPNEVVLQSILDAWKLQERRFAAVDIVWSQSLPSVWRCSDGSTSEGRVSCRAEMRDQVIRYAPARVSVYSPMYAICRTGTTTDDAFEAAIKSRFRINHLPQAPPVLLERYLGDGECLDRFAGSDSGSGRVVRNSSLGVLDGDLTSPVAAWFHPLLLAFRPAQFRLEVIGTNGSRLLPEAAQIEGRDCVRLVEHNEASDCEVELWLDSRRNFAIRRAFFRTRGELNEQVDLHYRDDDRAGQIPDSWVILSRSKRGPNAHLFPGVESLFETTVGKLSDLHVNEHSNELAHKPILEPGTVLADRIAGGTYRIGPDGSRKRISASELNESQSTIGWRDVVSVVAIGILTIYLLVRNRTSIWRSIRRSQS